jgi:hypothetical protein
MKPSETTVQHVYRLYYGDLGLCGCGYTEAAYELVRDILTLVEDERVSLVKTLIGNSGAYHLIMSALDEADIIRHGTSIASAWLTDKGRWYVSALRTIDDWDVLDHIGFPHDGEPCTSSCWSA